MHWDKTARYSLGRKLNACLWASRLMHDLRLSPSSLLQASFKIFTGILILCRCTDGLFGVVIASTNHTNINIIGVFAHATRFIILRWALALHVKGTVVENYLASLGVNCDVRIICWILTTRGCYQECRGRGLSFMGLCLSATNMAVVWKAKGYIIINKSQFWVLCQLGENDIMVSFYWTLVNQASLGLRVLLWIEYGFLCCHSASKNMGIITCTKRIDGSNDGILAWSADFAWYDSWDQL